ncbi:hypothetical protein BDW02DRAFT_572558 [Decorospora gaudefroyi]|uniref:Uncharacterized protein n=1 Tax=Decorospora gaudefroyi TaxID=184978 RepID=A0A6A5K016_9PLEO|nr:hypothetical protein BDW02DRAFT_572558 [Decorospora gaudefroyi]
MDSGFDSCNSLPLDHLLFASLDETMVCMLTCLVGGARRREKKRGRLAWEPRKRKPQANARRNFELSDGALSFLKAFQTSRVRHRDRVPDRS